MSETTDSKTYSNGNFLNYVESLDTSEVSEMLTSRIIPSFLHALRRHGVGEFSRYALIIWMIEMAMAGMKTATMQRYLGAIRRLYDEWYKTFGNQTNRIDFTLPDKARVSDEETTMIKRLSHNLSSTFRISKTGSSENAQQQIYLYALQLMLTDPTLSLPGIVNLKYSDPTRGILNLEDIRTSLRNAPQAKYVFPLSQGKRRLPAILRDLLSGMHRHAAAAGLDFGSNFSRDLLTAQWIAAAVGEGIPFGQILAIVPQPPSPFRILTLLQPSTLNEEEKSDIINRVGAYVGNKSSGCHVMRLRQGVKPDDIKRELRQKSFPAYRQIEFYYPQRKVKRQAGKKIKTSERPVVPGILFFRMQYDRISRLMSAIGQYAWCYRDSASPDSRYSSIPMKEMLDFQRSVGALTSDVEMEIISRLPKLKEGDEVIIEDGTPLAGQRALIRKVRDKAGIMTCTLRLSDTEFIRWRELTLPATSLTKTTE